MKVKQDRLDDVAKAVGKLEAAKIHLRQQVRKAIHEGASWAEVGEALGVSRQAAWERFGKDAT